LCTFAIFFYLCIFSVIGNKKYSVIGSQAANDERQTYVWGATDAATVFRRQALVRLIFTLLTLG
jgi:hypothetical protein